MQIYLTIKPSNSEKKAALTVMILPPSFVGSFYDFYCFEMACKPRTLFKPTQIELNKMMIAFVLQRRG